MNDTRSPQSAPDASAPVPVTAGAVAPIADQTSDVAEVARAARLLRDGGLVAFPTETVYGLGADALSDAAVRRIFAAKGRPTDHPLIVHVATTADVTEWISHLPEWANDLLAQHSPGPLTIVGPRAERVLDEVTGGQDTVAVRVPSHPVAHALLTRCRQLGIAGLVAPSANTFGHVSPTRAEHVTVDLGGYLGHGGRPLRWRRVFRSDHLAGLTPASVISSHRSLPSRVRSPTPENTE